MSNRHFSFEAFRKELEELTEQQLCSKYFYIRFSLAQIDQIEKEGNYPQERVDERRAHWSEGKRYVEEEVARRNMGLDEVAAWRPPAIVPTDKDVVVKMKPIRIFSRAPGKE